MVFRSTVIVEIMCLRNWLLCCNVFEVWVQISTGQGFWNVWFISSAHGRLPWVSGALGRFVLLFSVVSGFSVRLCSSEMPEVRVVLNDGHLQGPWLKESFLGHRASVVWRGWLRTGLCKGLVKKPLGRFLEVTERRFYHRFCFESIWETTGQWVSVLPQIISG